jgi:Domain of unknown function (DUF4340)
MNAAGGGRKRLLAVWVVLGLLAAGIALMEYRNSKSVPASVAEHMPGAEGSRLLVPAPIPDLGIIELVQAGRLHRFERDPSGLWYYHGIHNNAQQAHEHQTDPVQAEMIDKAFAALGRARMERQFKLDMQSGTYGLNTPQLIIVVYKKANPLPLAQFAVGDVAPDEQSRYVLPVGSAYVVTIADYQIGNLLSLIDQMAGKPASPAPAANRS